jgi:hypothetical protein
LLGQACAHCRKFLAAASRRSLGRVSVPVWLVVLTDQLPVSGLVGRYPTNDLMGRGPSLQRDHSLSSSRRKNVCGISGAFAPLSPTGGVVPTCSTAVRHSGAEAPACDLHALGTPPAFVLSQDQTLRCLAGCCAPAKSRGERANTKDTRKKCMLYASTRFRWEGASDTEAHTEMPRPGGMA